MSKNASVIDTKPQNELVLDTKPDNKAVVDTKPTMLLVDTEQEQYYTVTIAAGMYTGIPGITYPTTFTVVSPITP